MPGPAAAGDEPRLWRSAVVRDLAWAIGSPPLVAFPQAADTWADSSWYQEQLAGFWPVLKQLDEDPAFPGEAFRSRRDKRLGAWFESLLGEWLARDERYDLLARNLAIRQPRKGGGRETVGELDFVVRDLARDRVEHWEVAVKFYLGYLPGTGDHVWVGPGLKDRLDIKLDRLRKHQLAVPQLPGAQSILKERGFKLQGSRAIMKGRLFYPLGAGFAPPRQAAHDHLRGWWTRTGKFAEFFAEYPWTWRRLNRREWLAPVSDSDSGKDALPVGEFAAGDDLKNAAWPRMVAALAEGVEVSRGFVVPDNWGVPAPGNSK